MSQPTGGRSRLSPDDRRRQLIGIGLELLTRTPIHELSVDRVAEQAGISRSLLFHYFPTKRDYYAAVVRAGSRRLLRAVDTGGELSGQARLRAMVAGFVAFIDRRREPYVSFVRGSAGGDDWVQEIFEQTRRDLVTRFLAALDDVPPASAQPTNSPSATQTTTPDAVRATTADAPLRTILARGWIAYAEELTLEWTLDPTRSREELIDRVVAAAHLLVPT